MNECWNIWKQNIIIKKSLHPASKDIIGVCTGIFLKLSRGLQIKNSKLLKYCEISIYLLVPRMKSKDAYQS